MRVTAENYRREVLDEDIPVLVEFQVETVPAFVIFKDGEPVSVASGVYDKEVLLDMLWEETGLQI